MKKFYDRLREMTELMNCSFKRTTIIPDLLYSQAEDQKIMRTIKTIIA